MSSAVQKKRHERFSAIQTIQILDYCHELQELLPVRKKRLLKTGSLSSIYKMHFINSFW
jgi:hypothetical protein